MFIFCNKRFPFFNHMLFYLKRRCTRSSTRTIQGGEFTDSKLIPQKRSCYSKPGQDLKSCENVTFQMFKSLLQRVCKVVASRIGNSSLSGSHIQVSLLKAIKSLCDHFRTLDLDGNGYLDFKENMQAMDLVNAKTPVDKLKWAFRM